MSENSVFEPYILIEMKTINFYYKPNALNIYALESWSMQCYDNLVHDGTNKETYHYGSPQTFWHIWNPLQDYMSN